MKNPADWTVDELIALYLRAEPGATSSARDTIIADDVRAALAARSLSEAARELSGRNWWDPHGGAAMIRRAAGLDGSGKCPTCGRE